MEATWPKGDHGPFLDRLQQYCQRKKWTQLLRALTAAVDKALTKLQPSLEEGEAGAGRKRKRQGVHDRARLLYVCVRGVGVGCFIGYCVD